jgi:hypothetical protein
VLFSTAILLVAGYLTSIALMVFSGLLLFNTAIR